MAETGPKIRHLSRDFKTGEITETVSGGEPYKGLKVRHNTMQGGRPVVIVEGGGKLRVEEPLEDPEKLRPITQN
ncbi:MAG: hypothetical protein AAB875_02800, partial [Patescibacteria group bacterium]